MNGHKSLVNGMTFEKYKKPTRREQFLAEMEQVVPWKELCALIKSYYPKPRRSTPLLGWNGCFGSISCRAHFNLNDRGAEEALCGIESMG